MRRTEKRESAQLLRGRAGCAGISHIVVARRRRRRRRARRAQHSAMQCGVTRSRRPRARVDGSRNERARRPTEGEANSQLSHHTRALNGDRCHRRPPRPSHGFASLHSHCLTPQLHMLATQAVEARARGTLSLLLWRGEFTHALSQLFRHMSHTDTHSPTCAICAVHAPPILPLCTC